MLVFINYCTLKCFTLCNNCSYTVCMRYQTNYGRLKSTEMWHCVTGQALPGIGKDHSAFKSQEILVQHYCTTS